jgi:hypothetical protein
MLPSEPGASDNASGSIVLGSAFAPFAISYILVQRFANDDAKGDIALVCFGFDHLNK